MIEENLLTFNPDWDENANNVTDFSDVRQIQQVLNSKSYPLLNEADETTKGPTNFMVKDPGSNVILFNQHV